MKNASLIKFVKEHGIVYGERILSSGIKSNYFIDLSKITYHGEALDMITADILLHGINCHSIGGPELGAAPLVGGLLIAQRRFTYSEAAPLRGFMVRKEPKYGSYIEGDLRAGDRVLMVEDVVTTGKQLKKAIQHVEDAGARVAGVIAIVDRLSGAAETLAGYDFKSLMTVEDLEISEPQAG
jgi:orotate phosphoribosyltransferase